jgi:hypothetical protein
VFADRPGGAGLERHGRNAGAGPARSPHTVERTVAATGLGRGEVEGP